MTMRRALLFGFGTVFVLWVISAYDLVRRLDGLERRAAASSRHVTESEQLLNTVMAQVLLGAVSVRDVALEVDPNTIPFHLEQWRETRESIEQALEQYLPDVDSSHEREQWRRLESELDDYWATMVPLLIGGAGQDATLRRVRIREQALSKHEAIVRISDVLRRLNRAAFEQQQAEVALLHGRLRHGVAWMSGVMVGLGLLIAIGSTRYAGTLESRIRQQHRDEVRHKLELQELSTRLVDAQEQERRSLARDLHDEVGQALTAVKIELASLDRDLVAKDPTPNPRLREARSITDRTLNTVRDLSQLLHPGMLDDFGLLETVRWYVRGFSKRTGLRVQVVADEPMGRMPSDLEVTAYRIVQEALTNVSKHAHATSCLVHLRQGPATLMVVIEDDGRGFDPTVRQLRHGLGLVSMRERVAGFGGRFRVEPIRDSGTRLVAEFPLSGSAEVAATSRTAGLARPNPTTREDIGEEASRPAG